MPRRRAPPPRASAPPKAPPARSYSSATTTQQKTAPPPPAPSPAAPPPAYPQQSSGGGFLSGLAGTVVQGAALGTGSALAHRAVDSMFSSGDSGSAPAPQPTEQQTYAQAPSACEAQAKAFTDCMTANNGDMGACQFYFDALQQCKLSN